LTYSSNDTGSLYGIDDTSYFLKDLPQTIPEQTKEQLLTFSKNYNRPVRPIIEFRDQNGDMLDSFNSFQTRYKDPSIAVRRCEIVKTERQAGNFAIEIIDHNAELDITKIRPGIRVIVKMGREEGRLKNHIFGICTNMRLMRGRGDLQYWLVAGYGSGIITAETLLNVKKTALFSSATGGSYDTHDSSMYASNLIRDFFENEDLVVDGVISLRDIGNFDLSGISNEVREFIPSIRADRTEAGALCQHVADASGADYSIDAYNKVIFNYPSFRLSGITLKQYLESDKDLDYGNKTSYFVGDWTGEFSTLKENGFANLLATRSGKLREQVAGYDIYNSFFNLWNKDLAQQIPVTAQFRDLVFLMSKRGEGSPNVTNLHGHIIADYNGTPTGWDLATFDIPLKDIPVSDVPAPIQISDIDYNPNGIPANGLVWVAFYERGNSDENTINIYHDNIYTGFDPALNRYPSAIRPLPNGRSDGIPPHDDWHGWIVNQLGPQFVYSAFQVYSFSALFEDPFSQEKYRKVMAQYEPPWTDDLYVTAKISHAILQSSARPKADYSMNQVVIPEDYYFNEGDRFVIEDAHSGHRPEIGRVLTIGQSRIVFDSSIDQMGTNFMQILPYGFMDLELENLVMECGVC
jgi:hypothetical protein